MIAGGWPAARLLQQRRPAPPRGRVHARAEPAVLAALRDARRSRCALQRRPRGRGPEAVSSAATIEPFAGPPPPQSGTSRPRSTPTRRPTSPGCATTASRPAARRTGCSAATSTATPRSRWTAAPTARSKTCGGTRIDAAAFDWMGNDDHDNGGGKEYTWWLVQKTTDLYNNPHVRRDVHLRAEQCLPPRPPQRDVRPARGPHAAAAGGRQGGRRRRHEDALRLPEGARRHLRLAHLGHRRWGPTGATSTRSTSRSSRSSRGTAIPTNTSVPRACPAAERGDRRLEAPGHDLERAGDAVQARLPGLERPHLDPHQLRDRDRRGREPRGDLRRLQTAALLRRHRQHRARRP